MKIVLFAIAFLYTNLASATVENKVFDAKGLERLKLKNTSGDVKITVSQDGKAYVSADKVKFGEKCELGIKRSGDKLVVEVEKKGVFNSDHCKVNFEIKVPRMIALKLKSGSGLLDVKDTKGEIEFSIGSGNVLVNADVTEIEGKSGSGSIQVSGTIGEAEIKTGSGPVTMNGLTGRTEVKTGSGRVNLSYKSAPTRGKLEIRTGSGDATVVFPSNTKISTSYMAGSGRLYNELGDSKEASFKVSMKAGSGNLSIKKLK